MQNKRCAARLLLLALALAAFPCLSAHALTITVGSTGCDYADLKFVLNGLAGMPGPHEVRLRTQNFFVPDGLELDASIANVTIRGGYASCRDASPTAGQRSIIDASDGANGTAFSIGAAPGSPIHLVSLKRISVRGGTPEGGSGALGGGGLLILGKVFVTLEEQTYIENNVSGNGGGVLLAGFDASNRPTLQIISGSRIANNTAQINGGGVYCYDYASLYIDGGVVEMNTAAQAGGGVYLHNACLLDSIVNPGSFTGINENQAQTGAGLFAEGSSPLSIQGAGNAPFRFVGNVASNTGGGIAIRNNAGGRAVVNLSATVFLDNQAATRGAAMLIDGAVDLNLRAGDTLGSCAFAGVDFGACSAVIGNRAPLTSGSGGATSAIEATYAAAGSPRLSLVRTAFADNEADLLLHGVLRSSSEGIDIEGSLITRNNVSRGLLLFENLEEFTPSEDRVTWSTIAGNTRVQAGSYVLAHFASPVNLSGSIVYQPDFVDRSFSTGAVVHGGCLLVDSAATWPSTPFPPRVGNPNLDAALVAPLNSPAIDVCAATTAPLKDFAGNPRSVDQPGVPDINGPVDLGARELPYTDTIFANGFD